MNVSRSRTSLFMTGLGLVLVGLLTGVLIMLFVMNSRLDTIEQQPIVERVELGSPETSPLSASTDTATPTISVDPMTLNELFKDVSARVTPAVVYIQVESSSGSDRGPWYNFRGDRGPSQSVGSGVILSKQGYIITNNHVIEGAERILVTLKDKRQYSAEVIGTDANTDLAVIRIDDGEELPVITLGNSDRVEVGEWVLAIGNPFRLTSTVTAGIVSALGRQVDIIQNNSFGIEDFIQTDAAINPGNSGGALVNLQGELIGISTAIATESGSYEGYGFAVPSNLMLHVAEDLIAHGEVQRGFLGVEIAEVNAEAAEDLALPGIMGVFLINVHSEGAAYAAGLRPGDVVLTIEGQPVNASNELQSMIARHRPGDTLRIEAWRNGTRRAFAVRLFGRDDPAYAAWFDDLTAQPQAVEPERSEEAPSNGLPPGHPEIGIDEFPAWGFGLRNMVQRDRNRFGVQEGVYIAYVENASLADDAGVPRDVLLLGINEADIADVATAEAMLDGARENGEAVLLRVLRSDGLTSFYEMNAPADD